MLGTDSREPSTVCSVHASLAPRVSQEIVAPAQPGSIADNPPGEDDRKPRFGRQGMGLFAPSVAVRNSRLLDLCPICRSMACLRRALGTKLPADTGGAARHQRIRSQEDVHGAQGGGCTGDGRQRRARAAHLSRAGEGGRACRRHVCPEPRPGRGRRPRAGIQLSDQRRGVRLRHHRWRGRGAADRRRDPAPRPHRHPRQRRRLQQGDPVHRPRQSHAWKCGTRSWPST